MKRLLSISFIRLALVCALVAILGSPLRSGRAFGGSGPYNHIRITYEALDRFSQETGNDVNTYCAELLAQGAVVSDSANKMPNYTLHCDNNDLVGCSYRLDQFKQEANKSMSQVDSLQRMGQALHIVQDFYAHSNWAEIFGASMLPAPIKVFKDVPPPVDLQSGYFPDIFPDLQAQVDCFFMPQDRWNGFIYGATHACLNKDSNITLRGGTLVPNGFGVTYHELAAQYAINHSVDLLKYYSAKNPWFAMCFSRGQIFQGCNKVFDNIIH